MRAIRQSTRNHARSTTVLVGLVAFALLALPLDAGKKKIRARGAGNGDTAYTMWGISHHDIDGPADSLCIFYLTGQRVQSNGRASFAASYEEGSSIGSFDGDATVPCSGLVSAADDFIAIVLRTHGRYDGRDEQITGGEFFGCPECTDTRYACWFPGVDGETPVHSWDGDIDTICDPSAPVVGRATLEREVANEFGDPPVAGLGIAVHTRVP